jgi:hypothetical protein
VKKMGEEFEILDALPRRSAFERIKHALQPQSNVDAQLAALMQRMEELEGNVAYMLEMTERRVHGDLERFDQRLSQRFRRQAQMWATEKYGKGQVPTEVTDRIARIWLD